MIEGDDRPVLFGEGLDRGPQGPGFIMLFGQLGRPGSRVGAVRQLVVSKTLATAETVAAGVIGDREYPGREFGSHFEGPQAPKCLEERLLSAILGLFGVAHGTQTEVVNGSFVTLDERAKGVAVARESRGHELPVIRIHWCGAHTSGRLQERTSHISRYGNAAPRVSRNTRGPAPYLLRSAERRESASWQGRRENMDGPELLVPLLAIFCIFGLPVVAWMSIRAMAHRERMEMLRQGLVPNAFEGKARWAQGVPPPPSRQAMASGWSPDDAHGALRKGITVTMVGFAITIGLSFIGLDDGSWHPGPWLLGGLIPLFVGLAQVIIALMSGATLRPLQTWAAPPNVPPPLYTEPVQPTSASTPTYDASYTYRPGGTQELRPPSPPDRR
jgi:hypothetical protein